MIARANLPEEHARHIQDENTAARRIARANLPEEEARHIQDENTAARYHQRGTADIVASPLPRNQRLQEGFEYRHSDLGRATSTAYNVVRRENYRSRPSHRSMIGEWDDDNPCQ